MPRDMSRLRSRSPSYRRRQSPSPVRHRYGRRSRRDRSLSPYSSYSNSRYCKEFCKKGWNTGIILADWNYKFFKFMCKQPISECAKFEGAAAVEDVVLAFCRTGLSVSFTLQRKSRSISPRHYKSRSPSARRHKSRSPTPKRYKRQRSTSSSLSPTHKSSSPNLGSIDCKNACEELKKEEEERKRYIEAELKLIEEETAKRVEEAILKKVEERLNSDEIKQEIQKRLEEERRRLNDEVAIQLEKEKEAALLEARQKEEQARKEKEELEKMLEENRKRVEEAQRREALEQQRREEERYRELEELQRQKEEAMKRRKQQEEEERLNQMKLLGKNKLRPNFEVEFYYGLLGVQTQKLGIESLRVKLLTG
ncbi:hypothetical protein Gotur_021832 [Gossypium turneri]